MLNQQGKEFVKILERMKPSKHIHEIFSDWLVMAASALYSWKKDEKIENEYMEIAKHYTNEELKEHIRLIEITTEALEEKEQDFLGEVFTFANLTNDRGGQFFTPYHISYMSAQTAIDKNNLPKNRVAKISDPVCGSGGMLIAGAQVLKEYGFNFQQDALYIGQDIDARCARMTFIQLSLLGVPAVVYCMNTLTMQTFWHRETIGYHLAEMGFRLKTEKMIDMMNDFEPAKSKLGVEQSPPQVVLQGELF